MTIRYECCPESLLVGFKRRKLALLFSIQQRVCYIMQDLMGGYSIHLLELKEDPIRKPEGFYASIVKAFPYCVGSSVIHVFIYLLFSSFEFEWACRNNVNNYRRLLLFFTQSPDWNRDELLCFQPQLASLCAAASFKGQAASCHKLLPQQELPLHRKDDPELHSNPQQQDVPQAGDDYKAARSYAMGGGSGSSTDSPSLGSIGDSGMKPVSLNSLIMSSINI